MTLYPPISRLIAIIATLQYCCPQTFYKFVITIRIKLLTGLTTLSFMVQNRYVVFIELSDRLSDYRKVCRSWWAHVPVAVIMGSMCSPPRSYCTKAGKRQPSTRSFVSTVVLIQGLRRTGILGNISICLGTGVAITLVLFPYIAWKRLIVLTALCVKETRQCNLLELFFRSIFMSIFEHYILGLSLKS